MGYYWKPLIHVWCIIALVACREYPPDFGPDLCTEKEMPKFHIIVAGAGSAGSVLAARLSEEKSFNVLLLERGFDPPEASSIPIMWASMLNTAVDYGYVCETNGEFFQSLKDKKCTIPRGRMTGGSSSMNVAIYLRGLRCDFEKFEKLGCTGWGFDDLQKYVMKAENFHDNDRFDSKLHSIQGYLDVTPFRAPDPAIGVLMDGLKELGLDELKDLNGEQVVGYGRADSTTIKGRRCSTAKGYLSPVSDRKNLFFARGTLVKRVIVDDTVSPMRATGIEIEAQNGKTCIVHSELEVILSLGVIGSPQVLMLSGIGKKEDLEKFDIPVLKDLKTGYGYHDHPFFVGVVLSDRADSRDSSTIQAETQKLTAETYNLISHGVSTMGLTQLIAFVNTRGESGWHDIEIMNMRIPYGTMRKSPNGKNKLFNMFALDEETAELFSRVNDKSDTIFVMVMLSDIISKGYVKLNSTDVKDQPLIYTNMLRDKKEELTLVEGIKFAKKLAESKAVTEYGLKLERIDYPACEGLDMNQDEYWKCAIKQIATGFYHSAGTVPMGAEDDENAVVTPDLLVKGFSNLNVVDVSILTELVSRNPNAVVVTAAEKAADMIKSRNGKATDFYSNLY